jgi:hypothetical protein
MAHEREERLIIMETRVWIRGWTFERDGTGTVRVTKEPLVADSVLLGDDEWDRIAVALWKPGGALSLSDGEETEDGPEAV